MSATTVPAAEAPFSVAASFILGLFQPDDLICIMQMRDGEPPIHEFLSANQVATKQFLAKLQANNEAGFNIYVGMNPFKEGTKNRRKEFVARVSHVWCEMDDNSHLEMVKASPLLPKPHYILRSSEEGNRKTEIKNGVEVVKVNATDKFHVIWNVEDMPVPELESLERALVTFGNDPQAVDAVRVLRIPGFKNCKYVEQPVVELISEPDAFYPVTPYRREEFKVAVAGSNNRDIKQPYRLPEKIQEGSRNNELFKFACSLRARGSDEVEILAAVKTTNDSRTDSLPNEEIKTIVASAMKYPSGSEAGRAVFGSQVNGNAGEIVVESPTEFQIEDMPDTVLDGRLGEIYQKRLSQFPIAYAWTALTTVAGVLVTPTTTTGVIVGDLPRTNLYTVQIGPVGSGKSQVIDHARRLLGLPHVMYSDLKAGSMEGLLKKLSKDISSGKLMSPILQDIDEWKHYFRKADIEGASFMTVMNTGFYKDHYNLAIARGKEIDFNCTISWIGGVVQEEYDDVIGLAAIGGFYDRLYQGVCPTGYMLDYRPVEGSAEMFNQVPVKIDGSVYEAASDWKKQYPGTGRAVEVAVRVAHICASFDGRSILYGKDLDPAKAMLMEQMKVRAQFAPNVGENPDAKCQQKILQWLDRFTPNGERVNVRQVSKGIHAERIGAGVFGRCIEALSSRYTREIEVQTQKRPNKWDLVTVRRVKSQ